MSLTLASIFVSIATLLSQAFESLLAPNNCLFLPLINYVVTFSAIVCRSNAMNTFYPIGFFDSENGLRDLNSSVSVQLIESAYESIQNLIGE